MINFGITWSAQIEKILPPILRDRQFIVSDMDFMVGEPQNNYIEYILLSSPGHWKEFTSVGVNLFRFLQSTESPQVIRRAIILQLEADVFKKPNIDISKWPIIKIETLIFTPQ